MKQNVKALTVALTLGLFAACSGAEASDSTLSLRNDRATRPTREDLARSRNDRAPSFMGDIAFGGNGCPQGSGAVNIDPSGSTLSFVFDDMVAEAGRGTQVDRKSCNIAIPIAVPAGYAVAILPTRVRGYLDLPRDARAELSMEAFIAGSRGPVIHKAYVGDIQDDYDLNRSVTANAAVWSACGQDVILRTNLSLTVTADPQGPQALATVDSLGEDEGIHLQWRKCQ